jgi:hypothetical protein
MATFSVNQNRQLFVAKALTTSAPANVGDLKLGGDSANTYMYFQHYGYGGLTRSDKIDLSNVIYAKITKAAALSRKLKNVTVTLDSTVNSGAPISGQDYILRVFFRQYIGNSDIYQEAKYGAVHAYKGMSASDFYIKLAQSLAANFSKEATPLLKFYVKTASDKTEVTPAIAAMSLENAKNASKGNLTGTYTGVILEEVEQPWRLGVKKQEEVFFDVIPTVVLYNSEEVVWGVAEKGESDTTIKNGKKMADLEYFCMGERGDQYRTMGWPNNLETKYLVDPDKEYNVLDIHYYFTDTGVNVQKSEKDITILADTSVSLTALVTALKALGITVEDPASE